LGAGGKTILPVMRGRKRGNGSEEKVKIENMCSKKFKRLSGKGRRAAREEKGLDSFFKERHFEERRGGRVSAGGKKFRPGREKKGREGMDSNTAHHCNQGY